MLNAIVVDDEKPARDELIYLLGEVGGVEVVAEADCAAQAIAALQEHPCDVLFLDINMPDANGLRLAGALRTLRFPPAVVFVSAYSEYAVDAFEVKAVDYLLKPVDEKRLKKAIETVEKSVVMQHKSQKGKQIACEKSGKKVMINASDILFCTARDDYAYVEAKEGKFFAPSSLSSIEKQLDGLGFMRVHRSYLVNLNCVKEAVTAENGAMTLKIEGTDSVIPVSRRKIPMLKKAMQV